MPPSRWHFSQLAWRMRETSLLKVTAAGPTGSLGGRTRGWRALDVPSGAACPRSSAAGMTAASQEGLTRRRIELGSMRESYGPSLRRRKGHVNTSRRNRRREGPQGGAASGRQNGLKPCEFAVTVEGLVVRVATPSA